MNVNQSNTFSANLAPIALDATERLSAKARLVFGLETDAQSMWWATPSALQQSTRHPVAAFKASLLDQGPAWDLCCGLGADFIALARRGQTLGVDANPRTLTMAMANAINADLTWSQLQCSDLQCASVESNGLVSRSGRLMHDLRDARDHWLHMDPDRRATGKRRVDVSGWSPQWQVVQTWMTHTRGGLVKLAPATEIDTSKLPAKLHRMWISQGNQVREQTLLFGDILAQPIVKRWGFSSNGRSGVVLRDGQPSIFSVLGELATSAPTATRPPEIGQWIVDPDAAVRAAGLTIALAETFSLECLGGPSGFAIGRTRPPADLFQLARVEKIDAVLSCREKKWRSYFRSQDRFPESIKVRGLNIDPNSLTRKYRSLGQRRCTMWLGRDPQGGYCVISTPAPEPIDVPDR